MATALAPEGLFYGFQAAVLALIVRAVHGIGRHVLTDPWLWAIGLSAMAADLAGVHFAVTLVVALAAGPLYDLSERAAGDLVDPSEYVRVVLGE